jgi:ubiquinone/menaquinone biosynthesis C-methylase UbiE
LPFDDESFDVVVDSGVLEHVANPAASLTELHRVLAVGGIIVITFLPNRWSWTEWSLLTSGSQFHHRREAAGDLTDEARPRHVEPANRRAFISSTS